MNVSGSPHDASARIRAALGEFFLPRIAPMDRIGVGLSGGMDSIVLLHVLWRLAETGALPDGVSISALHVHHGISPRADEWANFCHACCARFDIPLTVVRVAVPRGSGDGLEGAARQRRYEVFAGARTDWLALAHHRDDQAETVLLNLLRGAGVSGASGMPVARALPRGPMLVRPLLGVERADIVRYAKAQALEWIEDPSNDDTRLRRNFLRHEIFPRLEQEFSTARATLVRAAGHFAEASALLDELAAQDCVASSASSGRVLVAAFNRFGPARAANLLRHLWEQAGFRAPDAAWIGEALKQLSTSDAGEIHMTTADGELRVYRGELYLAPRRKTPVLEPMLWSGEESLPWAGGFLRFSESVGEGIRRSVLIKHPLWVKPRQGGEHLCPDARRPRRRLRNLLQESAIPPWERERLPLLWIDDHLAWVGGIGTDIAFACAPDEIGILPSWDIDGFRTGPTGNERIALAGKR